MVLENGQVVLKWSWKNQIIDQQVVQSLTDLEEKVSRVSMGNGQDKWLWNGDDKGIFTVALMKKNIAASNVNRSTSKWAWNKYSRLENNPGLYPHVG